MRIEHVTPSRCREEFLARQAKNDAIKHAAKERGGALLPPLLPFPLTPVLAAHCCFLPHQRLCCLHTLKSLLECAFICMHAPP